MSDTYEYERIRVVISDSVATVHMYWPDGIKRDPRTLHHELNDALRRLRFDDDVRVVVLRGAGEGDFLSHFPVEPRSEAIVTWERYFENINNGMPAFCETILRMPKPVIAMVNGNALGIGATVVFACDLIIAAEDAYITDSHIAARYWSDSRDVHDGSVAGDGGAVFWPMNMAVCVAKEHLMLGRPVTAKELYEKHAINSAVPREKLQQAVDEMVALLLERPAWAVGWTKMVVNKRVLQNFELTAHASAALQMLSVHARTAGDGVRGITKL